MSLIPIVQENEKSKLLFEDLDRGDVFAFADDISDDNITLYIVIDETYHNDSGSKFNAVDLDGCLVHFSSDDEVALYAGDIKFSIDPTKFKTTKETK